MFRAIKRPQIVINRFDILKRDNFTCQYCGRKAPSVILEVDHIIPISKGGEDTPENLITSCSLCNVQKGNKEVKLTTFV